MSDGKQRGGDWPHLQMDFLSGPERAEKPDAPRVRVSSRARRLTIRVYPDARVEVVVPPRVPPREVEQFVSAHREWIEARRAMALRNQPAPQPFPPEAIDLRMTAQRLRLHVAGGSDALRVTASEEILRVSGAAPPAKLRRALRAWLLRAARERLEPRVTTIAQAMGVNYSQVSIRRQRSRWGSCSARGTISLNCCLLFQRPDVVDYLIVHELTHVKHMNHSARFWQAVERHCAGWRELDRELVQGWRHVPRWVFSDEN
jgi:predicted metal-dependent hydrolase